jgi:ankyrin repeat protein
MKKLTVFVFFVCMLLAPCAAEQANAAMGTKDFLRLCGVGTVQQIEAAIQAGADADAKEDDGATPLILAAAINKNPEVLNILIQAGANVNAKMNDDMTALMFAAGGNSAEVVNVLIRAGADVNMKNDAGSTALIFAADNNNDPELLKMLINVGADVNVTDNDGDSPLNLSIERGMPEFVSLLLKAGVTVSGSDMKLTLRVTASRLHKYSIRKGMQNQE